MAADPLRIGLIGCGGIASAHLAAYRENAHTEVAAVADIRPEAARAVAGKAGATAYTDYRQMLASEGLDGVSLLTPPDRHRAIAEAALAAGIHVLCEKPMAGSSTDAQAMADAAAAAGRLLLVAQCHRFHEPVRRARTRIEAGDLGQVSTYRNRFGYLRGTPDAATRGRGGVLLDNGSHSSYLFRYLAGEPGSVSAWGPPSQLGQVEDLCVCSLQLETGDGVGGFIELDGAARPCPNAIEVFGTAGSVTVDYSGGPSLFRPAEGESVSLDDPGLEGSHRFQREVDHFVACIRGHEEPEIGAAEGVADLLVLEAAYRAMCTGQRQEL